MTQHEYKVILAGLYTMLVICIVGWAVIMVEVCNHNAEPRAEWVAVPLSIDLTVAELWCDEVHRGELRAVTCPVISGEASYCRARCER